MGVLAAIVPRERDTVTGERGHVGEGMGKAKEKVMPYFDDEGLANFDRYGTLVEKQLASDLRQARKEAAHNWKLYLEAMSGQRNLEHELEALRERIKEEEAKRA